MEWKTVKTIKLQGGYYFIFEELDGQSAVRLCNPNDEDVPDYYDGVWSETEAQAFAAAMNQAARIERLEKALRWYATADVGEYVAEGEGARAREALGQ